MQTSAAWRIKNESKMKRNSISISDELKETDKRIAQLIDKRSRLLSRISLIRTQNNKSFTDPVLEKDLWKIWKDELKKSNQSVLRQFFTMLNSMGYSMAERGSSDKPFCLYPPLREVQIEQSAPRSVSFSRYYTLTSVFCSESINIDNFTINDNIIEIIKVANQCGCGLSWTDSNFVSQGGKSFDADGQNLFFNHSLFNFYFFLCMALGTPARVKINASASLKTVNLKMIQDLLPQLGARLSSIEPGSFSLPVRLESGAPLPGEIFIPPDCDPDFVKALILAAPSFEKPIAVNYQGVSGGGFEELFFFLEQSRIKFERDNDGILIQPSKPELAAMDIPADPILTGFVMAMAALGRGKANLSGSWPRSWAAAEAVLQVMEQCAVMVDIQANRVQAVMGEGNGGKFYDLSGCPEDVLPLAMPLALCSATASHVEILQGSRGVGHDIMLDILTHLGYEYEVNPKGLKIKTEKSSEKSSPWFSPDPYWTLGYCLFSFKNKGICLANPGGITILWPGFWRIFTNLSAQTKNRDSKGENNARPIRRRIRV